jgi:hypothetical protein
MRINIIIAALLIVLPVLANAEMKMQNSNPSPAAVVEPTLGHHMQNSDPSPEQKVEPAAAPEHVMQNSNPSPDKVPEHTMKNSNPKKWVSTNAASLEEKHTAK